MSSALVDQSRPATPVIAPMPPLLRQSGRVGLLVSGSAVIAAGVAVMLWTGLGPGPLDVLIGAVRVRAGLSLTMALWLVIGSLVAAAWLMGRRPGPGTLVSPLIVGPVMEAMLALLDNVEPPDAVALAAVIHVAAVFVVGVGAGALIVSGLGPGSAELLASAASSRTGRPETRIRMAFELTWLGVGVALGGPIGVGTMLVAFTIGPAVAVGYRAVGAVSDVAGSVAEYCDGKQRPQVWIRTRR